MEHYTGTPHATRTCPRRHLRDNADLAGVLALYRATEGRVGVDGGSKLSAHAVDGLAVLGDARAWYAEHEAKRHG